MQTIQVGHSEPAREPVQSTMALSTTAAHIGATITTRSEVGFELVCASAWFIGTSADQLRPVAATEVYNVPSSSLSGWYAKSAAGTPTLVATGAQKAPS
jgi:hypothetical protein